YSNDFRFSGWMRLAVVLATLALLVGALAPMALAARSGSRIGTAKVTKIERSGTTRITGHPARQSEDEQFDDEFRPDPEEKAEEGEGGNFIHNPVSPARVPSSHVPRPATQSIVDATGTTHFGGLTHFDNRFAGTGVYTNTNFSLAPA